MLIATTAIFGYLGIHVQNLRAAPFLELSSPPPGFTTANQLITIAGKTDPGARVLINGVLLPPGRNGIFIYPLVLAQGTHTLVVQAKKRYSKDVIIERQILILTPLKTLSRNPSGGM